MVQLFFYLVRLKTLVFFPILFVINAKSSSLSQYSYFHKPPVTKTNPTPFVYTPIPCKIPNRYKPLILPPISHAFPNNYYIYLSRFDGECNNITAERHVLNFESFLDLFEFDEEDVSIRPFALSLQGKAKSWFKTWHNASISNFQQFVKVFLDKWVVRKNHFLIIEEYNKLKRLPEEIVQ